MREAKHFIIRVIHVISKHNPYFIHKHLNNWLNRRLHFLNEFVNWWVTIYFSQNDAENVYFASMFDEIASTGFVWVINLKCTLNWMSLVISFKLINGDTRNTIWRRTFSSTLHVHVKSNDQDILYTHQL